MWTHKRVCNGWYLGLVAPISSIRLLNSFVETRSLSAIAVSYNENVKLVDSWQFTPQSGMDHRTIFHVKVGLAQAHPNYYSY